MNQLFTLNEKEFDALRECGNVGIGNAATALSKMINKKVEINIPETKFVPLGKFANEFGGAEKIVSGIYLEISGDLNGESLFVFSEDSAKELIDVLMGQENGTTKVIDENGESALLEMSNIFVGAYLNSLADLLGLKLLPNPPHEATDMVQALIDFMLIKLSRHSNEVLIVKEIIQVDGHNINGVFLIIFDIDSLKKTLSVLHEKYGAL